MTIGDQSSSRPYSFSGAGNAHPQRCTPAAATGAPAKPCLLITMQMFEVQLDHP